MSQFFPFNVQLCLQVVQLLDKNVFFGGGFHRCKVMQKEFTVCLTLGCELFQ